MINQIGIIKQFGLPGTALSARKRSHTSIPPTLQHSCTNENDASLKIEPDREVIRCITCGMVQYRTHSGNCRRCLHLLTPKVEFLIPPPEPPELPTGNRQLLEIWSNREMVENIGKRIRKLRESRGITQSLLQVRSRVSRSYLSRIESGQRSCPAFS